MKYILTTKWDPTTDTYIQTEKINPQYCCLYDYFLGLVLRERSSKLRIASLVLGPPRGLAGFWEKVIVLESGWSLWVVDKRPLLETRRLDLFEVGRLLISTTGFFELLPF